MHSATKKIQQGSALLVLVALILAAMSFVIVKALNSSTEAGRPQTTTANMTKAKEALVGFAASYRDTHTAQVNGYLPLPDLGTSRNVVTTGEGEAADNFAGNSKDLSVVGRFPWKRLGSAPLRDSNGECLWYAVSGTFQNAQKSNVKFMNWDTLGQFDTYTSNGTAAGTVSTIGTNYHHRPAAIIIAPGGITSGQTRTVSAVDTVTECGGNYDARNYLDTFNANPLLNNIVNYFTGAPNNSTETFFFATPKKIVTGSVSDASGNLLSNDMVLAITADDIFRVIKNRSDFANYVDHDLLHIAISNLALTLPPPVTINFNNAPPTEAAVATPTGSLYIGRVPSSALTTGDLKAWQDNLLYARCTSGAACLTVTDALTAINTNCNGVLIFAGDRTPTQTRATNPQKNTWNNYLENDPAHVPSINVLTAFTTGATAFTGYPAYTIPATTTSPSFDVLACIQTTPATQTSFAADFGSFISFGSNITPDSASQTVAIGNNPGGGNGCFWLPSTVAVAGKTVRSYYEYQFGYADTYAVTVGIDPDRGNGITLDFVDGTLGPPTALCGRATDMGAFISTAPPTPGDTWALESFTIETDVYRDASDSVENHTAIMAWGNLAHGVAPGSNGYLTAACNGTAAGCRFTSISSHPTWTANQFEEWPTPLSHNQRVEIHGRPSYCYDSSCLISDCSIPTNTYTKISTWVDCTNCNDVTADSVTTPTINRCIILTPELNSPYIALTGGFRSGAAIQSVTLSNFILRSE